MILRNTLYGINDVTIIPSSITSVKSRFDCDCRDANGKLPLIVSPMSSVVNEKSFSKFLESGMYVVLPRTLPIEFRIETALAYNGVFAALGLSEAAKMFLNNDETKRLLAPDDCKIGICIDVANGHMTQLIDLAAFIKKQYGDKVMLMVGNIANPSTYEKYASANIDYVRVGIGSGSVCTTSANSGVHYPMASLLNAIRDIRSKMNGKTPDVIADGGFDSFDKIIKALALGANYVMIGKIPAQSNEACGEVFYVDGRPCRNYYGMSTKKAQREMNKSEDELRTSEGVMKQVPILYSIFNWVDNFSHYLREAMSMTNSLTLEQFTSGDVILMPMTASAYYNYYK